jgi:hypothetical protein
VSATASSSALMISSASSTSVPAYARASASARTRSSSSGCIGPTCQACPAGLRCSRPAATSFIASIVAALNNVTDACASPARSARVRTGIAPRIGSRIVRCGPLNSISLSRGGSARCSRA